MYMLLNWSLRHIPGMGVILTWNVVNNIKFYSDQNIFISKIEEGCIDNENKQFNSITHSGSNYIVKFEDINIELVKNIEDTFEFIKEYLDIYPTSYKDNKERLKKFLLDILKSNELYIENGGIVFKKAFFMTDKRKFKEIPIKVHIGTFQDSVLIITLLI